MHENKNFLTEQIITYLGNKRTLLPFIENEIQLIQKELSKNKLVTVDLFSGSGIVARLLKQYSSTLITNDLEKYNSIINKCYLTNKEDFDDKKYNYYYKLLCERLNTLQPGIITRLYAPVDDNNIQSGERVFYTHENAMIIDTIRTFIDEIEDDMKIYFLAPLIYEASVHTNTSGVFKGFYKDSRTGIGKFGGNGENALSRIKSKIELPKPIFSEYSCISNVYQQDSNKLVKNLKNLDIVYIDPPYNQHPYGSNYFMLNLIVDNIEPTKISEISGIPNNWNRSDYNKKQKVYQTFDDLIKNIDSKYIIISYNSEGFISFEKMLTILKKYGKVKTTEIKYNTFRGSRNLKERDIYVNEYLFILRKGKINVTT